MAAHLGATGHSPCNLRRLQQAAFRRQSQPGGYSQSWPHDVDLGEWEPMAAPGALIAERYRLVRQLGAGGMGVVWEARDERLDRPVAVKELRTVPGLTQAETDVVAQRAMREARINARLHHPHAVTVFDVVEHEGKPCIVMELVPSVPLTDAMRELGALAPSEAAQVGSQVAAALAAAHALGIVHRDVKPGNVLIGDDGAARICDFGISRAAGDTTLTTTGMITGTPAYLAPEAARGEESTSASDVYSLGATLYAAVEGAPPFGAEGNAISVLYRVTAGELKPPERAGALGPLIVTMMSREPQDRPSMAEAAAQLSALAKAEAVAPAPGAANGTLPLPVAGDTSAPTSPAPTSPAPTSPGPTSTGPTSAAPTSTAPTGSLPDTAPVSAGAAARTSSTPAQWTPTWAPATARPAAPTTKRRRRPGLVAAIVVLIVLAGTAVVALWLPNVQRPTASGPSPAVTTTDRAQSTPAESTPAKSSPAKSSPAKSSPTKHTSTGSSATPSDQISAPEPTAAELAQAVTDYYGLLPDDTDAAWQLLTASYQRQTGGRRSYENFWNGMDTVTVTAVRATAPDQVEATLTYVEKRGNRKSTERRSFRLVRSGDVLKINQSSVI